VGIGVREWTEMQSNATEVVVMGGISGDTHTSTNNGCRTEYHETVPIKELENRDYGLVGFRCVVNPEKK